MNILGLVFPSSLFQLNDQKKSSDSKLSMSTCSAADCIAKTSENITSKNLQNFQHQDSQLCMGSCQKCSHNANEISSTYSGLQISACPISNSSTLDESIKGAEKPKKKKKKKKKKGKSYKKHIEGKSASGPPDFLNSNVMVDRQPSVDAMENDHGKDAQKCMIRCPELIFKPQGSENISEVDGAEFIHDSKESSRIAVSQDIFPGCQKTVESCKFKLRKKHNKISVTIPASGVGTCSTSSKSVLEQSGDAENSEITFLTKPTCQDESNVAADSIVPGFGDCRNTEITGQSNTVSCETKISELIRVEISSGCNDFTTEHSEHVLSPSSVSVDCTSPCSCCSGSILTEKEAGIDGNSVKSTSSSQNLNVNVRVTQTFTDTSSKPNFTNCLKQLGKENAQHTWQKTRKNIGAKQAYIRSCKNNLLWINPSSLDMNEPIPECTARCNLQQRAKNFLFVNHGEHYSAQVLPESPRWVSRQSFPGRPWQHIARSREDDAMRNCAWKMSKGGLTRSFRQENANNVRRFWISRENLCKLQMRDHRVQSEVPEVPIFHPYRSSPFGQRTRNDSQHQLFDFFEEHEIGLMHSCTHRPSYARSYGPWARAARPSGRQRFLNEIQLHAGMMIQLKEDIAEIFESSPINEERNPANRGIGLPYDISSKKWTTSSVPPGKWVPFQEIYDSKVQELLSEADGVSEYNMDHDVGINKHMPELCVVNDRHVKCLEQNSEGHSASDRHGSDISRYIGSQVAVELLNVAYMVQLASDIFQLATGKPIAEFERLLYYASPIIVPSLVLQHGEASSGNQLNSILWYKFKNLKVLLHDVWSWFEKSSSYGLEVEAEVIQKSKKLVNEVDAFQAHFVPFLSAVQLFGRPPHLSIAKNLQHLDNKVIEMKEADQTAYLTVSCPEPAGNACNADALDPVARCVGSFSSATSAVKNGCTSMSFQSSDTPEVIFEYFEHGRPHERKPLYAKIKELVEIGASNPQVYGDPTKLEHINLEDLHPASWFSVAWYPIYRIPEGTFHAAFLTYHSLGHLVLRRIKSDSPTDNAFCAVAPVLGMRCYKAKDEGWLDPKMSPETLLKDGLPLDSSGLVEKRLRTLEETAAMFARWQVHKDQIKVTNSHPDYEFFLPREY